MEAIRRLENGRIQSSTLILRFGFCWLVSTQRCEGAFGGVRECAGPGEVNHFEDGSIRD